MEFWSRSPGWPPRDSSSSKSPGISAPNSMSPSGWPSTSGVERAQCEPRRQDWSFASEQGDRSQGAEGKTSEDSQSLSPSRFRQFRKSRPIRRIHLANGRLQRSFSATGGQGPELPAFLPTPPPPPMDAGSFPGV